MLRPTVGTHSAPIAHGEQRRVVGAREVARVAPVHAAGAAVAVVRAWLVVFVFVVVLFSGPVRTETVPLLASVGAVVRHAFVVELLAGVRGAVCTGWAGEGGRCSGLATRGSTRKGVARLAAGATALTSVEIDVHAHD